MMMSFLAALALSLTDPTPASLPQRVIDTTSNQTDSLTVEQKIGALAAVIGFRQLYLRDTIMIDQCALRRMLGVADTVALPPNPVLQKVLSPISKGRCTNDTTLGRNIFVAKIERIPSDPNVGKMAVVEIQIYAGHYYHDESYRVIRDYLGPKPPLPYSVASMAINRYGTMSRISDFVPR